MLAGVIVLAITTAIGIVVSVVLGCKLKKYSSGVTNVAIDSNASKVE
jgi:hypothetical protein